jgi:two-component system nitrate/nitrite sensor histidine kinase NarX
MRTQARRHLGSKLALVAAPFIAVALLLIAAMLWISWHLDGGAAALNEAGRMRMQIYRLSLSISSGEDKSAIAQQVAAFDKSLALLRQGDNTRPLFVPWNASLREGFKRINSAWTDFRERASPDGFTTHAILRTETIAFADEVDAMVAEIEAHLSRWTTWLHLLQATMLALAVAGSAALVYTGHMLVLEPIRLLKRAIDRLQGGDPSARVDKITDDEFGTLALGFNNMADHLQSIHRSLEARVAEKTAELEEKRERLETLYSVTALGAEANTLEELARGFTERVVRVARADAVALRWSDEGNQRYLLLASQGLPASMVDAEHCVHAHECHCGVPNAPLGARIIPIHTMAQGRLQHCVQAGFQTIVSLPIRMKDRLMGEVDLFYHAQFEPPPAERSLLEALAAHLAGAMENLRLNALEKEAAVSQERSLLARELHDSIAQSLAFLKIQVQLMRDAMDRSDPERMRDVLAEIDLGVRESYADVRELLLNFRTRASEEDIAPALQTTLRKFEHQSGLRASLQINGHGMPLAPQAQIQVLHVVQEALSNIRKHAGATQVWLDVKQQPQWRFEVRDNGCGFKHDPAMDETHVGLRIMRERASQIGASLEVISAPARGTSVILELPRSSEPPRGTTGAATATSFGALLP